MYMQEVLNCFATEASSLVQIGRKMRQSVFWVVVT
jgi:hypothetical protein